MLYASWSSYLWAQDEQLVLLGRGIELWRATPSGADGKGQPEEPELSAHRPAAPRYEHDASQRGAEGEGKMMEAGASFLSDVPRAFLQKLTNDSRVQKVGIVSAKKLRQMILREIKEEVKKTKKDPMQVLESAIKQAGPVFIMCLCTCFSNCVSPHTKKN